ncbi:putative manganese transporter [Nocardioides sp. CFH 31398]|uniref:putative manganese transporter n=1 Tax=Nocardioides sp. CFH 31398 TaxID=2919579 RepID=UPI001F07117A|nr:putative manganese transporter [Nocardioides sp. CFH 31398]MCH1868823.1 putative manganese transporter [Nocardioides sp. CFH 31398]
MTQLLLQPLADAFMQVGVFVALAVAPFGWAQHRWGARLAAALERHARWAPLVGAALTMPPGCGGAIVVVTAYARGAVSYGTAVAALVATMGDVSWVLLAADPVLTVQLKAGLLVVGATSGWLVDAAGIAPRRPVLRVPPAPPPDLVRPDGAANGATLVHSLGVLPVLLWLAIGGGAVVGLPVTLNLSDPRDLYLVVGLAGAGLCLAAAASGRLAGPGVLRESGAQVAQVTTWVSVAYVGLAVLERATGFDGSQLPVHGLVGVLVGVAVGLVPGCAAQIVFVGVFTAGGMPLSTLAAATVSQDGDALLPLLALHPRAAVLAGALTAVPALLVGAALLLLT